MALYFRDKQVTSVFIDETRLRHLIHVFEDFFSAMTPGLTPEAAANQWLLSYIVRFDEKGYRVFSGNEVLDLFRQAGVVERVFLTLESRQSLETNRVQGEWAELRLDAFAPNNCWLSATSNSKGNVDAVYQAIDDALSPAKTRFWILRSVPTRFGIQVVGVLLSFLFAVWGGLAIGKRLSIDNAFPIAFLFVFLIFSNIWGFFHPWVLRTIDRSFPNIYFKRSGHGRWTWLWQGLIVSVIFAVLLGVTIFILHYLAGALAPLVKTPTLKK